MKQINKKEIFKEAEECIYKLFSPNGYTPSTHEVREIIRWIYDKGREHPKMKGQ